MLIVISGEVMGKGDEGLGKLLMKSYLYALSENENRPESIIFLNSGVKLVAEGSTVIESLKALGEKGVTILSCGTCLDFFNLKDKLEVGEITNMYTIVNMMNTSKNIITL